MLIKEEKINYREVIAEVAMVIDVQIEVVLVIAVQGIIVDIIMTTTINFLEVKEIVNLNSV